MREMTFEWGHEIKVESRHFKIEKNTLVCGNTLSKSREVVCIGNLIQSSLIVLYVGQWDPMLENVFWCHIWEALVAE